MENFYNDYNATPNIRDLNPTKNRLMEMPKIFSYQKDLEVCVKTYVLEMNTFDGGHSNANFHFQKQREVSMLLHLSNNNWPNHYFSSILKTFDYFHDDDF